MKLQDMTWEEVDSFSRDAVVLIPTGSLEQHGPHLPLFTDTEIVTAVAEGIEKRHPSLVLLTPTIWLGASGHHLAFAGSLSADFRSYMGILQSVVKSLLPHGFRRFYVLNGHGGNNEPNGMAIRELKEANPNCVFAYAAYYEFVSEVIAAELTGPSKQLQHACEAETSLMLHLRPGSVRVDRLCDDGLATQPSVTSVFHLFDEKTSRGSLGFATHASAGKGKVIFEAAVAAVAKEVQAIAEGYVLTG